MKKTKYFIKKCSYSNVEDICNQIISQRDNFLLDNEESIAKIDSEDLRVDSIHPNQSVCILRLTYFEK